MSMNLNRVMLAGNLTRDPEIRFLANEKAVGEFGLAVNRRYKDANGEVKEEVTFVDIEVWGRTAELVGQYLTKGKGAFVEGRLKLDSWEDKETGGKRSKLRVVADQVQFTGSPDESTRAGRGPNARDETEPPAAPAAGPARTTRPAAGAPEAPPF